MAGFRNRQGRAPGGQRGGYPQQQGGFPGGPGGTPGGYPGGQGGPGGPAGPGGHPGRPGAGHGGYPGGTPTGEPEYYGGGASPAPSSYDDNPGHTRAFTFGAGEQLADPYQQQSYEGGSGYGDGYEGGPYGGDNVATYRAGQSSAPPVGPRLHWKELLSGIVLRPGRTFWTMRDHTVWGPALIVTFLYGLLAVFGFDGARGDILNSTLSTSIPWVLTTGVAVVLCGVTLGAVTNTLARQLGGDGAWAPTVGLAMLISSLTDAPRLLFALFLGGGNGFVQLMGWLTWLACAALMTSMVAKSHDLPWHRALGASSIQLVALLMLFKLPLI